MAELEVEKQKQIELMEEYNRRMDLEDEKRAKEKADRHERIQKIMNRMGDVVKKSDAAEREFDRKILRDQLQKDKQAAEAERKVMELSRQRNRQIKVSLDAQIEEQRKVREMELKDRQEYIQQVI